MSQANLLAIARSWLGTPFQHQGRLKGIGVDCIGLVIEVYREAGLLSAVGLPTDWNYTGYGRQAAGALLETFLQQYLRKVSVPFPAGSVGIFPLGHSYPTHSALLFPDGDSIQMIHAYNSQGHKRYNVQEHALRGIWRQRLWAVYGLPGGIP